MRIGILGAGQLGRMLAMAGSSLGHKFMLYDFNNSACPGAGELLVDKDRQKLEYFLDHVDCVTFELEHIPLDLVEQISERVEVLPNIGALALGKDREQEKNMFLSLDIPTTRFFIAMNYDELLCAVKTLGGQAIVKTTTGGYDGKGQVAITKHEDIRRAWETLRGNRLIVEEKINFDREISIIACRSKEGEVSFYPPSDNTHIDGILRFSVAPAPMLNAELATQAKIYINKILERLDYVGVLALELFVCDDGLLANEIATRVHNSGHWTMDGAVTSQFENHIRAIAGQPLGSTEAKGVSFMMNIIGEYGDFDLLSQMPEMHCYHYGKKEKASRKLGHVNLVSDSFDTLLTKLKDFPLGLKYLNGAEALISKFKAQA